MRTNLRFVSRKPPTEEMKCSPRGRGDNVKSPSPKICVRWKITQKDQGYTGLKGELNLTLIRGAFGRSLARGPNTLV